MPITPLFFPVLAVQQPITTPPAAQRLLDNRRVRAFGLPFVLSRDGLTWDQHVRVVLPAPAAHAQKRCISHMLWPDLEPYGIEGLAEAMIALLMPRPINRHLLYDWVHATHAYHAHTNGTPMELIIGASGTWLRLREPQQIHDFTDILHLLERKDTPLDALQEAIRALPLHAFATLILPPAASSAHGRTQAVARARDLHQQVLATQQTGNVMGNLLWRIRALLAPPDARTITQALEQPT